MQHLEGSGTPVLYIGRRFLKVKPCSVVLNCSLPLEPPPVQWMFEFVKPWYFRNAHETWGSVSRECVEYCLVWYQLNSVTSIWKEL